VQDLTGKFPAHLVNSSMNGGNTTAGDPKLAMTAPGSVGINPVTETPDILPQPALPAEQVPVSNAPHKPQPAKPAGPTGYGTWGTPKSAGGFWKETP
jgi:hypothetical protein